MAWLHIQLCLVHVLQQTLPVIESVRLQWTKRSGNDMMWPAVGVWDIYITVATVITYQRTP